MATDIRIAATSADGGRLLLGDADVELRGGRIAAGLAAGFLDRLDGGAMALIGNANSPLYNAALGGGSYAPGAGTLVSARSLTLRYGQYALFQNTGVAGVKSAAVM